MRSRRFDSSGQLVENIRGGLQVRHDARHGRRARVEIEIYDRGLSSSFLLVADCSECSRLSRSTRWYPRRVISSNGDLTMSKLSADARARGRDASPVRSYRPWRFASIQRATTATNANLRAVDGAEQRGTNK